MPARADLNSCMPLMRVWATAPVGVTIVSLSVAALIMLPSAAWSQDENDLLRAFTPEQQASMQRACRGAGYSGPATFYGCLQGQVTALRNSQGAPDLSPFTPEQQASMQRACRGADYSGPATFYRCLQQQVTALRNSQGAPDLSAFTPEQQASMRRACRGAGYSGPATFYSCLQAQVAALAEIRGTSSDFERQPQRAPLQKYPDVSERAPAAPTVSTEVTVSPRSAVAPDVPPASPPESARPSLANAALTETVPSIQRRDDSYAWVFWLVSVLVGLVWFWKKKQPKTPCRNCGAPNALGSGLCAACQAAATVERLRREREARESAAREAERARQRADEERLNALRTMESLHALSGIEFEDVIATLLAKLGCRVTRTRATGDEGIDLVLHLEGVKLVVQCKRWRGDIGAPIVRDFFGALIHAGAAHGFIITTARFTPSAVSFARQKPLTLIDGRLLLKWLAGSYQPNVTGYARQAPRTPPPPRQSAPDPYEVLRVPRGASRDEIRAAYRREIAQYHPDKVAQLGPELRELATEKSKQINEAYRILLAGASG